jgi:hypothetical protein
MIYFTGRNQPLPLSFFSLGLTAFGGLGMLEVYGVKSFCAIYQCLDDVKAETVGNVICWYGDLTAWSP